MARATAATALSAAAKALAVGSRLTDRVAELVRDDHTEEAGAQRDRPEPHAADDGGGDGGRGARREVSVPPTEPVPQVPAHARTHETHVEELASGTAAEVIAAIPGLSTDELGRLYEHESSGKRRKSVLAAIERAADPNSPEPMPEAGGVPTAGGST